MNRFYILCSFSSIHPYNVWIETSYERFKCIQHKFFRRNEHIVFKWFHKISNCSNVLQVKYLLQMKNTWNEIIETGVPFSQYEQWTYIFLHRNGKKFELNYDISMQIEYNLNTFFPLPHKLNVQLNRFLSSWIGIVKCIQRENLGRASAKISAFDIAFHFSVQVVFDVKSWKIKNIDCHISMYKYQLSNFFCSQQKANICSGWIFHFAVGIYSGVFPGHWNLHRIGIYEFLKHSISNTCVDTKVVFLTEKVPTDFNFQKHL